MKITRKMKWVAKLAFPQINTQKTQFRACHHYVWACHHFKVNSDDLRHMIYDQHLVYLNRWRGIGYKTRVMVEIGVGYCEKTDVCYISHFLEEHDFMRHYGSDVKDVLFANCDIDYEYYEKKFAALFPELLDWKKVYGK